MKKFKNLQLILVVILCITLSALFVACNSADPVKISFETNGGSIIAEMEIDEDFQMPANPTKKGFTFDGWYIDQNLTTKFDETKIAEYKKSFKVFAKWADIPLDQIFISTPVLSKTGNVVSWDDVTVTENLEVVYFVSIDNGAALAYSAKSVSLDMFTTGEHTVSVYAALASNNIKKSNVATITADVVAVEDNAVINTGYAGIHSTLAQEGDQKVLVFYLGLTELVNNATDITVDSPVVKIETPNNGTGKMVKPLSVGGPFELKVTSASGTTSYKAYVRPRITGFSVLNNNVADRIKTNFQNKTDTSYKIGVENQFGFNTQILDGEGNAINNRYVPLSIQIKNGNTIIEEGENTYQNDKGVLTFDDSFVGQTYTISIIPKYFAQADANNVKETTMDITFTKGINVFNNEQLKSAVQNCAIEEISIHDTIVAEYNNEQKLDGVDYAGQVQARYFTKENYKKSADVYARFVEQGDSTSLKINGNYFDINAKNLARLKQEKGKNDGTDGFSLTKRESNNYEIYNQESGLFAFGSSSAKQIDFAVTIDNLHVVGNCDLSNETDSAELSKEFILQQSGSLHGIVASGVKVVANNVWLQNIMQGFQLRHRADWIENQSTLSIKTEAILDYCKVENTFYSAAFVVNAKASVKNSYFKNCGAAIFGIFDDYQYGSDTDNETSYATHDGLPEKSGYPFDPEITLDSSNVYDSWSVGNEAYYSTEGEVGALAMQLKQTVNGALDAFATGHTITNGEKFNFILQFIKEKKFKKMKVVFTDGNTAVTTLDRGALYTQTQSATDGRLQLMGSNFMYPIGKYSAWTEFIAMAYSKYGVTSPADPGIMQAIAHSFANDLATFGENKDRKLLEVLAGTGGEEITAIVEVMPKNK